MMIGRSTLIRDSYGMFWRSRFFEHFWQVETADGEPKRFQASHYFTNGEDLQIEISEEDYRNLTRA